MVKGWDAYLSTEWISNQRAFDEGTYYKKQGGKLNWEAKEIANVNHCGIPTCFLPII